MARSQAQYVRIYAPGGATFQRWQHRYPDAVTFAGELWTPVPFTVSGMSEGTSGQNSDMTISVPATGAVVAAVEAAITNAYLVEVSLYQFDTFDEAGSPPAGQQLVAAYTGQVVGGGGSLTRLEMKIGTPLSSIGSQVPPRSLTTAIMGTGVRL